MILPCDGTGGQSQASQVEIFGGDSSYYLVASRDIVAAGRGPGQVLPTIGAVVRVGGIAKICLGVEGINIFLFPC